MPPVDLSDPNLDVELEAISRSTDLHALEQIIHHGRRTFLEVGAALLRIREARLYKLTHSSWESWCLDRWGSSKRHADRQISAVKLVQESNRMGPNVPVSCERQARELARAPSEVRHLVAAEVRAAIESGETPTAGKIRDAVTRIVGAKPPRLQNRRTPRRLFDLLNRRFGPFELDAFAEPHNALCQRFYAREDDGCSQPWADVTFANPEFADMRLPLEHAVRQSELGIRSCVLGPVGCSQAWFHELAIRGTIYLPDLRINYDLPDGTPTKGADRDTIVMMFGGEHENKKWRGGQFRVMRLELS